MKSRILMQNQASSINNMTLLLELLHEISYLPTLADYIGCPKIKMYLSFVFVE